MHSGVYPGNLAVAPWYAPCGLSWTDYDAQRRFSSYRYPGSAGVESNFRARDRDKNGDHRVRLRVFSLAAPFFHVDVCIDA